MSETDPTPADVLRDLAEDIAALNAIGDPVPYQHRMEPVGEPIERCPQLDLSIFRKAADRG